MTGQELDECDTAPLGGEMARGWRLILGSAVGVGFGITGLGFYSLGLFVKPLQAELGWPRAAISGAALALQAGVVLSAPIAGRLADHWGARLIALGSLSILPLAFLMLASWGASSPMSWWLCWFAVSLAGAGTTPAIWTHAVSADFDRRRGLALGLTLMGTGLAAIFVPALLGPIFAAGHWRQAVLLIAAAVAGIALPLVFFLFRPRQPPLRPDPGAGRIAVDVPFVTLALCFPVIGGVVAGFLVHLVSLLTELGLPNPASVAAFTGLAVIVGRIVVGLLFDRFSAPFVGALFLTLPILSFLAFSVSIHPFLATVALGLAAGAEIDMLAYLVSRFSRSGSYGATYGALLALFSLGAGIGPIVIGAMADADGGYGRALRIGVIALSISVLALASLGLRREFRKQIATRS